MNKSLHQVKLQIESRFAPSIKGKAQLAPFCGYRGTGIQFKKESILFLIDNDKDVRAEPNIQNTVSVRAYVGALFHYVKLSIDEILCSHDPIVRALGMLDARFGKNRLAKLNVRAEPLIVRKLFALRCEAEGFSMTNYQFAVTSRAQPRYNRETDSAQVDIVSILAKRKRNTGIKAILNNWKTPNALPERDDGLAQAIYFAISKAEDPNNFAESIRWLMSSSKLVNKTNIDCVLELICDHESWIRPLTDWKPKSHNKEKQLSSLIRHLFAQYAVPLFMDKAWLTGSAIHQEWFKHIASGSNIRTAKNLPIALTKSMAHHFLEAPEHYSIQSALRWGQLRSLGCDRQMCDAVVQTRLRESSEDDEFWMSVFRFLANNPMLDPACVGPIVDYIWNQKYEPVVGFVEHGVVERMGPAQPNFCMKGRTVETLMQQVERWHHALNVTKAGANLIWRKSSVSDFEFVEGSSVTRNMKIWRIRELLSSKELSAEGRQLKHCVATYAQSCNRGESSIWSMTLQTTIETERVLTIEVRQKQMTIRQVRGKLNRFATEKEKQIIQRWCTREELAYEK